MKFNCITRLISVAACLILTTSYVAPALAFTLQNRRDHAKKPGPKVPVMKGVPRMDLRRQGSPPKSGDAFARSLLDQTGTLTAPVTHAQRLTWRTRAAQAGRSRTKAAALIALAEYELAGDEQPHTAAALLDRAMRAAPPRSPELALAKTDHGLAVFHEGEYYAATLEFARLLRSRTPHLDRKFVAILYNHARACTGYHAQRQRAGITEPTYLDPLCAVASLAVCLRELDLPHDKARVVAAVRHTGEGSNLQDVLDAAPKLGASAYVCATTDKGTFIKLPKPLVAHVEHDHFVAVTDADADGVVYMCSDCGSWPGGLKRVSWKQWRMMEADAFAVVVTKGSDLDRAFADRASQGPAETVYAIAESGFGSIVSAPPMTAADRLVASLGRKILIGPFMAALFACGEKTIEPRCPGCGCPPTQPQVQTCPMAKPFPVPAVGPSFGDPIDLATGEEEYKPADDLDVYNPVGTSIHFGRIYDSLRTDGTQFASINPNYYGFGQGWSNPYNIAIVVGAVVAPGGLAGAGNVGAVGQAGSGGGGTGMEGAGVILANGAVIQATYPTGYGPLGPTHLSQVLNVPAGYPVQIIEYYDVPTKSVYATCKFPDRTMWTSNGGRNNALNASTVVQIQDADGHLLGLNYTTYLLGGKDVQLLTSITGGNGTLLTLKVNSSTGMYTEADDCYGRSVYYTYSGQLLTDVSQIVPTGTGSPPVRYQYGYGDCGNGPEDEEFPYVETITVPSPTGVGTSTATISYDPTYGLITGVTDANGNSVTVTGTSSGSGSSFVGDPVVTYTNAASVAEYQYKVQYDSNMDETEVFNASGAVMYSATYADPNDPYRPSSVTDALGHTWNFSWDTYGNLLTEESPKSVTTFWTYNYDVTNYPMGELRGVVPAYHTPTSFTYYEPSGHIRTVAAPIPGQTNTGSQQTTTYTWTSLGNLSSITSPGNNATSTHTVSFNYTTDGGYGQSEALGEPLTVTDTTGDVTHFRYDNRSNLLSETDALGNTWQATYDPTSDQVTAVIAPATGNTGSGNATTVPTYLYPLGPVTTVTAYDESGSAVRSIAYTYGKEGETLGVTGDAETTSVTYGSPYWIKSVSDGNGNATTYTYGSTSVPLSGDLTGVAYPGASGTYDTVSYVYNVLHELTQRTDGNGVVTNYLYSDGDGMLSNVQYPAFSSQNVAITYDNYDRPYAYTDGTGSLTDWLDDLGNVTQSQRIYTGLPTQTLTYSYYPDNSRSAMTTPAGNFSYDYDADGRYTSMSCPAGGFGASWYANGWQESRDLSNGIMTGYSYNAVGALTGQGDGSLESFYSFTYDGVFNTTGFFGNYGVGSGAPTGTRSFGYDAKDRLTSSAIPNGSGTTSHTFGFDGAGNRNNVDGTSIPFNADNQLSASGFGYDGNGNATSYNGVSIGYDQESRATSIGSAVSATYRADGLRASKTTSAGTTYYLYDGGEPIVELDGSGNVSALNVFAPDGLVARQAGGSTTEYVFDPQGNVANRTDSSGAVLSTSQYDAWGNEQVVSGSDSDPFGFNGQSGYYLDRESGLYLCQHRFYDPGNGRWLNRDPIGYAGGTNLYGYCRGGPVGHRDSRGFDGGDSPAYPAALQGAMAAPDSAAADAADAAFAHAEGVTDDAASQAAGQGLRFPPGSATAGAAGVGAGAAALGSDADAPEQAEGAVCNLGREAYNWIERAAEQYPKLANKFNLHHLIPKYQGGPEDGPLVRLPASAHQVITNAFRAEAPYGDGFVDADRLNEILERIYNQFPLPPEWFQIH